MKKDKTPWPLKVIRWTYPKLELVVPGIAHRLFLRVFFTPFRYPVPDKEKKAEKFAERSTLKALGLNIQLYNWGTGSQYILLVHGWAGRATQFRRFVKPLLKSGYRVIGFDGPAHGASEGKSATFREFEETIKVIYAKFGIPQAIVAHSYGGNAVLFAAMNGLQVRKLVNIASPTIAGDIVDTYAKAIGGTPKTKAYFYDHIQQKYGRPFTEFTALHFVKHLPKAIDLLLVHDSDDKEVGPEHPEELLKVYPSAKYYKTKGLGHTRILRDDAVIREIVTFIKL